MVITALTDNVNRAIAEVKTVWRKHGLKQAAQGSVLFQFEKRGRVEIQGEVDEEQVNTFRKFVFEGGGGGSRSRRARGRYIDDGQNERFTSVTFVMTLVLSGSRSLIWVEAWSGAFLTEVCVLYIASLRPKINCELSNKKIRLKIT